MSVPPEIGSLPKVLLQQQNSNYQNLHHAFELETQKNLASLQSTTLDTQLLILKKEMVWIQFLSKTFREFLIWQLQYSLRQLDLNLLSKLWSLNESIQEFRAVMQEQENLSPNSPTPSISSDDDTNGDKNNNILSNTVPDQPQRSNDITTKENDFIEDMHRKLERQIRRMNVSPPKPPKNSSQHSLQSPSRPVWYNQQLFTSCNVDMFIDKINQLFCVNTK
jgi:hypothetical protein